MNAQTLPKHEIEIYGTTYKVEVGSYIEPERWRFGNRLEKSEWDGAQFYLPTNSGGPVSRVAVNIEITGRTFQRRAGSVWLKVKVEFVEDGDGTCVTTPGWLLAWS